MTHSKFTPLRGASRRLVTLGGMFKQLTYPAPWLPPRLHHPAIGYLAAICLEFFAVGLIPLLMLSFTPFVFQGALLTLIIVLVALNWGAGPSLLATFVGAILLVWLTVPPSRSWEVTDPSDLMDMGLYCATGVTVSLVASQVGRAQRKAEQAAREAQQARKQMEAFVGIASHELKTPLTTLTLQLDMTTRRLQRLASAEAASEGGHSEQLRPVQESLTRMKQHLGRLTRLVNDLVDVTHLQAGELELRVGAVDLAVMVRSVVEEQRQATEPREIYLRLPADQAVPLLADAQRIEQVLTNYLSNALKYSPATEPVEVGLEVEGLQARVWVRDAGPGIPVEEQAHIWERFHRVPGITVQSGSGVGLGLGLSICREIVERHHGQVGVQSEPGQGATFWFTLPLAPQAADSASAGNNQQIKVDEAR
jgi:signal transduction histidine kinase